MQFFSSQRAEEKPTLNQPPPRSALYPAREGAEAASRNSSKTTTVTAIAFPDVNHFL